MKLIFERSKEGRRLSVLPQMDVPACEAGLPLRETPLHLPEVSENELSRHYTELAKQTHGVNDGFYPLGSCTMKYNPKVNEEAAALRGFTGIHPLQPEETVQGCLELLKTAEEMLCEITGMDAMTFQPAAGAHGEYTGLLLIKAYLESRGQTHRKKIIVPDSAHGTNPASAVMAGFTIVNIPSAPDGCVDIEKLREAVGEDTAGLMLTNPNTLGLFDKNILEITKIIHEAGGLCYYDGANLNAVMGQVRPGDMGFDVIHLNLHKTFSTPHGGGGPGSGPVGCKALLEEFLPGIRVVEQKDVCFTGKENLEGTCCIRKETSEDACFTGKEVPDGMYRMGSAVHSIGSVKAFYGNFLVVVKALTYLLVLGKEGIPEASANAVLNANYMKKRLEDFYEIPYPGICMHEFVMSLEKMKREKGVSAMDIAKSLLDYGIHPPTMYFPLIVHEALMIEPAETESKETLDHAVEVFREIYEQAAGNPEEVQNSPKKTAIGRPDEVQAARKPVLRYSF